MEEDFLTGNKVLLSKRYTSGTVYMVENPNDMFTVIAFDKSKVPLCARTFVFTENLKKEVVKASRRYFKQVQECLYQKKLEMIEELDFE